MSCISLLVSLSCISLLFLHLPPVAVFASDMICTQTDAKYPDVVAITVDDDHKKVSGNGFSWSPHHHQLAGSSAASRHSLSFFLFFASTPPPSPTPQPLSVAWEGVVGWAVLKVFGSEVLSCWDIRKGDNLHTGSSKWKFLGQGRQFAHGQRKVENSRDKGDNLHSCSSKWEILGTRETICTFAAPSGKF